MKQYKKKKKKFNGTKKYKILYLHVKFNKSNIIVNLTETNGNTINWFSCGAIGLKGFRKGTVLAAQKLANHICRKLEKISFINIILITKGFGKLKTIFIKNLIESKIKIKECIDVSAIPFNGCRPNKKRKI